MGNHKFPVNDQTDYLKIHFSFIQIGESIIHICVPLGPAGNQSLGFSGSIKEDSNTIFLPSGDQEGAPS